MKKSVLIVDDNDRYANNLKIWFEQKGFETVRAVNAAQGWEIYSKDKKSFSHDRNRHHHGNPDLGTLDDSKNS